jgi:hypothetical protein
LPKGSVEIVWVTARVADPGSGAFLTPGSGIQDGEKINIRIRNIPDHISKSLETISWVKKLKFFDANPESF